MSLNFVIHEDHKLYFYLKNMYKTAYEVKQKAILDLAADRQPFIDQSQSMNFFIKDYDINMFSSMQMYAWERQLKTGSYYIRMMPGSMPEKFTIDINIQKKLAERQLELDELNTEHLMGDEMVCLMCQ